jgi:DNA-binding response OmpR family regulator
MTEVRSRSRRVALVVEDDPLIQDALKLALVEEAGFQVLTASVPEMALPLLEAAAPEVVLLDLGLPGPSGWSVLAAVRHHPQFRTVPVLVVTAHREATPRVVSLHDPWVELLLKPFALETLLERVEALIQRHRTWQTEASNLPGHDDPAS